MNFEESIPDPEYLIKSIAEQGYNLETALADLIDNSISADADKIEVLINMEEEPFVLFIADNGSGMSESSLKKNMRFPSNSPGNSRAKTDLGRFGLGMKTASFAQTRKFTVISRLKGDTVYQARTWDVDYLTREKQWKIIVNTSSEIEQFIKAYKQLSSGFLGAFEEFEVNTIVVWQGLYKYESYIDAKNRRAAIKSEINDVTSEHLSIVFHRFMERPSKPVRIRVNNILLQPFNPFPTQISDFRRIPFKQKDLESDTIKLEGYVLPSRSIKELKEGSSIWSTRNRSLMDMEGIYIYRSDRLIRFGSWNGIIKKSSKHQLARLMVDVGNSSDHLIHLNVAKSQIKIPYELKRAFESYIELLTTAAIKELYNTGNSEFVQKNKRDSAKLFNKKVTGKGVQLKVNSDFPLLRELRSSLNKTQVSTLNIIVKSIETRIDKIRRVHEFESFVGNIEEDSVSEADLISGISILQKQGYTIDDIKENVISELGFSYDTLPKSVQTLLSNE